MLSFALNAGTKSTDIKTGNTNIIDGISPEVINGLIRYQVLLQLITQCMSQKEAGSGIIRIILKWALIN